MGTAAECLHLASRRPAAPDARRVPWPQPRRRSLSRQCTGARRQDRRDRRRAGVRCRPLLHRSLSAGRRGAARHLRAAGQAHGGPDRAAHRLGTRGIRAADPAARAGRSLRRRAVPEPGRRLRADRRHASRDRQSVDLGAAQHRRRRALWLRRNARPRRGPARLSRSCRSRRCSAWTISARTIFPRNRKRSRKASTGSTAAATPSRKPGPSRTSVAGASAGSSSRCRASATTRLEMFGSGEAAAIFR